jgi:hypothetical protein
MDSQILRPLDTLTLIVEECVLESFQELYAAAVGVDYQRDSYIKRSRAALYSEDVNMLTPKCTRQLQNIYKLLLSSDNELESSLQDNELHNYEVGTAYTSKLKEENPSRVLDLPVMLRLSAECTD